MWLGRSAVLLALVPGCTEPYGICLPGNVADPGPGCTAPAIATTIDGDPAEWRAQVAMPTCVTTEPLGELPRCIAGYVREYQFGREAGALVFQLATEGAPVFDALYRLELYQYWDLERLDLVVIGLSSSGTQVRLNDHLLSGYAIEQARGSAGIEVRVPLDVLPFPERADVRAFTIFGESGHVQPPAPSSSICWAGDDVMACRID